MDIWLINHDLMVLCKIQYLNQIKDNEFNSRSIVHIEDIIST